MVLPFRTKGASGATGPSAENLSYGPGVHNEGVYHDGRTDGWTSQSGERSPNPADYDSGAYHQGYADGVELYNSGFGMEGERLPRS